MKDAALEFKRILKLPFRMYVENPIMHRHALKIIGIKSTQIIQPYEFGHTTSKATCLWLKGLPKLESINVIAKEKRTF